MRNYAYTYMGAYERGDTLRLKHNRTVKVTGVYFYWSEGRTKDGNKIIFDRRDIKRVLKRRAD